MLTQAVWLCLALVLVLMEPVPSVTGAPDTFAAHHARLLAKTQAARLYRLRHAAGKYEGCINKSSKPFSFLINGEI